MVTGAVAAVLVPLVTIYVFASMIVLLVTDVDRLSEPWASVVGLGVWLFLALAAVGVGEAVCEKLVDTWRDERGLVWIGLTAVAAWGMLVASGQNPVEATLVFAAIYVGALLVLGAAFIVWMFVSEEEGRHVLRFAGEGVAIFGGIGVVTYLVGGYEAVAVYGAVLGVWQAISRTRGADMNRQFIDSGGEG